MLAEHQLPQHITINLVARFLFTSLFLLSGITHFTNREYYLALMPEAVPYKAALIWVSGVVELAGALMILFNWRPRLGGWLLVIFLLPVTFVVHGYEMLYAQDAVIRELQQAHFLKGFALTGAALLVTQIGVSRDQ
jgi:uncharacterized membrane protein